MNIRTTRPFDQDFAQLPESIKRQSEKQFQLLLTNPRHPSLRLKKMEDPRDIWEGRITRGYRFTFQIVGETYLLRRIGTHDVLRRP
jgi:mRNA-degrading endonuclease RelE of RelBE toxin-antitoxin system